MKNNYPNLIPLNKRTKERRKEIQSKGGKTVTSKKRIQNRINGMARCKNLTKQQKMFISLIQEKQFLDLICELIAVNLQEADDFKKRSIIIDQLTKFIPNKNLIMDATPRVDWDDILAKTTITRLLKEDEN